MARKEKKIIEGRDTKDLEIDESLLSEEEKDANKLHFPIGLLIFMIVIVVLIIAFSIVILCL